MKQPAAPTRTHTTGDLVLVGTLAALVALYLIDAIRASTDVINLILVLPLSVLVLALCVAQFVIALRDIRARMAPAGLDEAPPSPQRSASPLTDVLRVIGLFGVYVLTLPWLGFDIGTCLFLAAFLWLHGERRRVPLIMYSLGFGLLIAVFFSRMLPYPMPMLLLGGA